LQELSLPAAQELGGVAFAKVSRQELDRLANYWFRSSQEFELTGGEDLRTATEMRLKPSPKHVAVSRLIHEIIECSV